MEGAAATMSRVTGHPVPVDVVDSFDDSGLVEPDPLRERGPLANSIASRMMGSSQEVDQAGLAATVAPDFGAGNAPLPDSSPAPREVWEGERSPDQLVAGNTLPERTQGAPIPSSEPRPSTVQVGTDGRAHVE
jgi:hypothetical protein